MIIAHQLARRNCPMVELLRELRQHPAGDYVFRWPGIIALLARCDGNLQFGTGGGYALTIQVWNTS